jgi:hypothetical protein
MLLRQLDHHHHHHHHRHRHQRRLRAPLLRVSPPPHLAVSMVVTTITAVVVATTGQLGKARRHRHRRTQRRGRDPLARRHPHRRLRRPSTPPNLRRRRRRRLRRVGSRSSSAPIFPILCACPLRCALERPWDSSGLLSPCRGSRCRSSPAGRFSRSSLQRGPRTRFFCPCRHRTTSGGRARRARSSCSSSHCRRPCPCSACFRSPSRSPISTSFTPRISGSFWTTERPTTRARAVPAPARGTRGTLCRHRGRQRSRTAVAVAVVVVGGHAVATGTIRTIITSHPTTAAAAGAGAVSRPRRPEAAPLRQRCGCMANTGACRLRRKSFESPWRRGRRPTSLRALSCLFCIVA